MNDIDRLITGANLRLAKKGNKRIGKQFQSGIGHSFFLFDEDEYKKSGVIIKNLRSGMKKGEAEDFLHGFIESQDLI